MAADMLKQKKNKKRSPKKKDGLQIALYLLGTCLIIGSLAYLGNILLQYKKGESEYDALQEIVFAQAAQASSQDESSQNNTSANKEQDNGGADAEHAIWDKQIMQAIGGLKEQNEDVIGWITFDNMELSYPIMQGEDNDYYLKHTFSGETNSSGSIFMEAANASNFQDCHTIIYGHNMRNLSMFGQLKKYKTEEFYEEHQYFTIYTEDAVYRYQIFAYYDISEAGDVYTIGFQPDADFQAFVDTMQRRSYYDTNVKVTQNDKVVTLSTCSGEGKRFVVNAKRIEE